VIYVLNLFILASDMEALLKEGLDMISSADESGLNTHQTTAYIEEGYRKLHQVGLMVHKKSPDLADMITYAQTNVPAEYHNVINHAWSGIGDWTA
jgi:hypothetical protein